MTMTTKDAAKPPLSPADALVEPGAPPPLALPDPQLLLEVQQFLFREVRLFEEERYVEWLGALTEDIHYWMPGVQARYRKDKAPRYSATRMAHFDDDLLSLRRRVTRALHPTAWAEDPPTRACYAVSNIEVEPAETAGEYRVQSVMLNCRGRGEADEDWIMVRRKDVLRRVAGELKLARREIYATQSVILSKNINILF
jgi:ethylbenzene dioxygenase beta subunit